MADVTTITYSADFTHPLVTVQNLHQAVRQWCALLNKRQNTWDNQLPTPEEFSLLSNAHRFFSTEVHSHWLDEEIDLFPPVTRVSLKFAEAVFRAKTQHRELRTLWNQLAADMEHPAGIASLPEFSTRLKTFLDALEANIKYEDADFYARAQHLLSAQQLQTISENMHERRKSASKRDSF